MLKGSRFGLDHLTVVLGISRPGQHIRLHQHDYEEIIIVQSGIGTYTVGDGTYQAGPGEIVLIPSGVPYGFSYLTQEPLHHTAVHSSGTFVVGRLE